MTLRARWALGVAGIIALGIGSRTLRTGWIVLDKYLGDALYAVMFYAIVRLFWVAAPALRVAVAAMAIVTAIECFQLTLIPLHMLGSANPFIRVTGRLLGTEFSFLDLLAYAAGIVALWLLDSQSSSPA